MSPMFATSPARARELSMERILAPRRLTRARQARLRKTLAPRSVVGTNQHVIDRMCSVHGDWVWGFIPTGIGLTRIKFRKAEVVTLLNEAGGDRPAICRYYVRQGEPHVAPLSMPVPPPTRRKRRVQ